MEPGRFVIFLIFRHSVIMACDEWEMNISESIYGSIEMIVVFQIGFSTLNCKVVPHIQIFVYLLSLALWCFHTLNLLVYLVLDILFIADLLSWRLLSKHALFGKLPSSTLNIPKTIIKHTRQ